MELASFCMDRQIRKLFRLHDYLIEWRNKCYESKTFVHHQTQMPLILKHCTTN